MSCAMVRPILEHLSGEDKLAHTEEGYRYKVVRR